METHPPERIDAGRLVLRRLVEDDVEPMAACITRNLEHLQPWMPWATAEAGKLAVQRERIAAVAEAWEKGEDYHYLAITQGGEVLGRFGALLLFPWA